MDEIGLVDAIAVVREELVQAILAGADRPIQFPVASVQLTFQVGLTDDRTKGGKINLSVLQLSRDQRVQHQSVHTVTVTLGGPVDGTGTSYKVGNRRRAMPGQTSEPGVD